MLYLTSVLVSPLLEDRSDSLMCSPTGIIVFRTLLTLDFGFLLILVHLVESLTFNKLLIAYGII